MKSLLGKVARKAAALLEGVARYVGALAMLLRIGPRSFLRHRRAVRIAGTTDGATFANGVTTTFTPRRAAGWHRVHRRPLVIVLYGPEAPAGLSEWMRDAHAVLHARFVVAASLAGAIAHVSKDVCFVEGTTDGPRRADDLWAIRDWMHQTHRRHDVVLLDTSHPLPGADEVVQLQHAAHEYHHDAEIGFVTPAYLFDGERISGFDFDRLQRRVVPSAGGRDYGQSLVPRYVLCATAHGLYITAAALDRTDVARRHLEGLSIDEQAGRLVRKGWAGNIRTLCLSSVGLVVNEVPQPILGDEQRRWQSERTVTDLGGRPQVVFVLNATSISGGIRVVFEMANGLSERGFDVEVWSLQGRPTWFDLRVPLVQYRSYEDLLLSLRGVDAIKVATWWETAEIVWLSCVNHGIPVYLIQEFETWFYPDDPIGQAAVVASYRREFHSVTQASFQREELAEVGVAAELVPIGYDETVFHVLSDVRREPDTVLALGRSFFQKNFEMTRRAWLSMGDDRPHLLLFGTEPDILDDARCEYVVRPSDARVNELYNRATVMVQTSRHEGFCLPILEAMAAGCPVIATDSHGNRDFCTDGVNCIIVPQDDHVALADAIARVLGDTDLQQRLRTAGLETAARFRWGTVLEQTARHYRALAGASAPAEPPVR